MQARPNYSNDYLNQLKAANVSKSIAPPLDETIDDSIAYGDETSLARDGASVEDDDFIISGSSNKILPSENAIAAAKLRRETARRLGVENPSTNSTSQSDDFVSLQVGAPTSKRESRLVREEDELGEGEDDFSQFTGAQERIALGRKGQKDMERKRKDEMRALIEGGQKDDDVMLLGSGLKKKVDHESDEEEKEWELAQIRRGEQRRGMLADEDGEPYRPANGKLLI